MLEARFRGFLTESFAILQREVPAAYAGLCRVLALQEVVLTMDQEPVGIRFEREQARLLPTSDAPTIEVRTDRTLVLDLIDARCTLHEAILSDRLLLRGRPDALLLFHDGLMLYLHGALRAPSFPQLLQWFRSAPRSAGSPTIAEEIA